MSARGGRCRLVKRWKNQTLQAEEPAGARERLGRRDKVICRVGIASGSDNLRRRLAKWKGEGMVFGRWFGGELWQHEAQGLALG